MADKKAAELVGKLKKEELLDLVRTWMHAYPELEKDVELRLGDGKDEVKLAGELITKHFTSAKGSYGFITASRSHEAFSGIYQVLEHAKALADQGEYERGVKLNLKVLGRAVDSLQFMDDSNGEVSTAASLTMNQLTRSAEEADDSTAGTLLTLILKEARLKRYNGWSDFRIELLRVSLPVMRGEKKRHEKVEKALDDAAEAARQTSYPDYELEQLELLRACILDEAEGKEAGNAFRQERINEHPDFVLELAAYYLDREEWDNAEAMIETGKRHKKLVHIQQSLLETERRLYSLTGNREKEKESLRNMLLARNMMLEIEKTYQQWKELHEDSEWETALKQLLNELSASDPLAIHIGMEEDKPEVLLAGCEKDLWKIRELGPRLQPVYPDIVREMFSQLVDHGARMATNRKQYRALCRLVKQCAKVNGKAQGIELIAKLRNEYPRRSALMEELEKTEQAVARFT
ncbi:hypothetical protein [Alkalicoccus luteus]|uniref:Uncharacterized protein n=1 Tax=Alkalicoccus luteus TaxID=1237094 RepID=A0A969PTA7_9BACI|nr:hypothetical protein [Alkalicoccus luteus]NJP37981.1 hypothetical protein [Alkalicoccus luteus]